MLQFSGEKKRKKREGARADATPFEKVLAEKDSQIEALKAKYSSEVISDKEDNV